MRKFLSASESGWSPARGNSEPVLLWNDTSWCQIGRLLSWENCFWCLFLQGMEAKASRQRSQVVCKGFLVYSIWGQHWRAKRMFSHFTGRPECVATSRGVGAAEPAGGKPAPTADEWGWGVSSPLGNPSLNPTTAVVLGTVHWCLTCIYAWPWTCTCKHANTLRKRAGQDVFWRGSLRTSLCTAITLITLFPHDPQAA